MGCNGCGRGSSKNKPTILVGDVDGKKEVATGVKRGSFIATTEEPLVEADKGQIVMSETQVSQQQRAFEEAKKLSIEDIVARVEQHQKMADVEIEKAFSEMTEAMRHFHVLNLLSVANYENLAAPGLSPEQAIVGLRTALMRKDFSKINELYPNLYPQVESRYKDLMDKKITL